MGGPEVSAGKNFPSTTEFAASRKDGHHDRACTENQAKDQQDENRDRSLSAKMMERFFQKSREKSARNH
jgi:hypothetical protein